MERKEHEFVRFRDELREDYEEMKIQEKKSMKMELKGSRCRSA